MDDLVKFIQERTDEDERIAKAATSPPWSADGMSVRGHERPYADSTGRATVLVVRHTWPQESAHIIRHDPARTLREVEMVRAILAEHATVTAAFSGQICRVCWTTRKEGPLEGDPYPCRTLRLVAAIWSDHPDYKEEWKP